MAKDLLDIFDFFEHANTTYNESLHCNRYYTNTNGNTTTKVIFYVGGKGVPENLIMNIATAFVCLVIFSKLRKSAWNYGLLALIHRRDTKWTSMFYYRNGESQNELNEENKFTEDDTNMFSWLFIYYRLTNQQIIDKCGMDALQYLSFQRHLMLYITIITGISLLITLPINLSGNQELKENLFGRTTMSNLDPNSKILWYHIIATLMFTFILLVIMVNFTVKISRENDSLPPATIMIRNVPNSKIREENIIEHFSIAYPHMRIVDIVVARNIRQLSKVNRQRELAEDGRISSQLIYKITGERLKIYPNIALKVLCPMQICKQEQADAINYYYEMEKDLKMKCLSLMHTSVNSNLGIYFVTLSKPTHAIEVKCDFNQYCKSSKQSYLSSILNTEMWHVTVAPPPSAILWDNLTDREEIWWLRYIIINLILVIVLFFMTTPSIFLELLNRSYYVNLSAKNTKNMLIDFIPTSLLILISSILPNIVYMSDSFVNHWTRTSEHHHVMRKTLTFLMLMVLVLPSLGFTSIKSLLTWAGKSDMLTRWKCIYPSDNVAFFVNYVITSAFVGNLIELMRIPELFMYALGLLFTRSIAERYMVTQDIMWEFQYGIQYAWILCIISVVVAYSVSCPIIAPFGLVYLLLKHLIDRYNLFFVYKPSQISQDIHQTAINFSFMPIIAMQTVILGFIYHGREELSPIIIFQMLCLGIMVSAFMANMFFGVLNGWCRNTAMERWMMVYDNEYSLTAVQNIEGTYISDTFRKVFSKATGSSCEVFRNKLSRGEQSYLELDLSVQKNNVHDFSGMDSSKSRCYSMLTSTGKYDNLLCVRNRTASNFVDGSFIRSRETFATKENDHALSGTAKQVQDKLPYLNPVESKAKPVCGDKCSLAGQYTDDSLGKDCDSYDYEVPHKMVPRTRKFASIEGGNSSGGSTMFYNERDPRMFSLIRSCTQSMNKMSSFNDNLINKEELEKILQTRDFLKVTTDVRKDANAEKKHWKKVKKKKESKQYRSITDIIGFRSNQYQLEKVVESLSKENTAALIKPNHTELSKLVSNKTEVSNDNHATIVPLNNLSQVDNTNKTNSNLTIKEANNVQDVDVSKQEVADVNTMTTVPTPTKEIDDYLDTVLIGKASDYSDSYISELSTDDQLVNLENQPTEQNVATIANEDLNQLRKVKKKKSSSYQLDKDTQTQP